MDTSTFSLMDYVQRIKLELKRLANSRVTSFFAKSLEPKGTLRCPTNALCQQQIGGTADVASGPGIQRGKDTSNENCVRKQSDVSERRSAIDPPAANINSPVINVQRTAERTQTASATLKTHDDCTKTIRNDALYIKINECGQKPLSF